jgi:hypothetical protein
MEFDIVLQICLAAEGGRGNNCTIKAAADPISTSKSLRQKTLYPHPGLPYDGMCLVDLSVSFQLNMTELIV